MLSTATLIADSQTESCKELEISSLMRNRQLRLIVIRHGEAIHNLSHLMTSSRSPGVYLTEKGIQQVLKAAHQFKDEIIDIIYVSPVFRTLQTAQLIGRELNVPFQKFIVDDQLREQYFGEYEERTYFEYKSLLSTFDEEFHGKAPGGESGKEVHARTVDFLHKIALDHHNETILIVTHCFNCCQIGKCLTGSYPTNWGQAEFKIYDFRKSK